MKTHTLKTDGTVFQESVACKKTYEIRFDDRRYEEGDTLVLLETVYTGREMFEDKLPLVYSGRVLMMTVTHVLRGPIYGLCDKWVLLSVKPYAYGASK